MKDIVLLVLKNGIASTVIGPLEVFAYTGNMWNYLAGIPLDMQFRVRLASIDGKPVRTRTGLVIQPDCNIHEAATADAVLITSCGEDIDGCIRDNAAAIPWIIQHYEQGAIVGSICSGLALLAASGLLDGKKATTHWGMVELFRRRFPKIEFRPDALMVDEGRLLTCGGGYAGNDLSLHLVEKCCGRPLAKQCADALLLETGRQLQTPFAGLLQHRLHQDPQIQKIQAWLDQNYTHSINLDELAIRHNMSPRNFIRRFKQASGETPLNYLQKLRVEAAKKILEQTNAKIEVVAGQVGYETEAHFRQIFKRYTALTPARYRSKYAEFSVFDVG